MGNSWMFYDVIPSLPMFDDYPINSTCQDVAEFRTSSEAFYSLQKKTVFPVLYRKFKKKHPIIYTIHAFCIPDAPCMEYLPT